MSRCLNTLLVEDNSDHVALIEQHLDRVDSSAVELHRSATLSDAIERVGVGDVDVILLDLGLPDSQPRETLGRMLAAAPKIPIVVLTTLDDESFGMAAVHQGAQDFLVKSKITGELLLRSMRYAIERKQAVAEIERSNRDLQQFAHVVAHDLKSPLSVMTFFCHILRAKFGSQFDDEIRRQLQSVEDTIQVASQLIERLLEYARAGSEIDVFEAVDFNETLQQAKANLLATTTDSHATIAGDRLPTVYGDRVRLVQLLQNLIGNAIKYRRDSEPPMIHVKAKSHGEGCLFSIEDNGIGIATNELENIFEMFHRGGDRDSHVGIGIGLATCKRIVENHGGRIWVESKVGRGSTFYFTLPRTPQDSRSNTARRSAT